MIVINRGTSDGVKPEMAVITHQGLVGSVVEASPNSAKVELLLDPRSSIGTLVQRPESRVAGIIQGDPSNPMVPRMVNIPRNADIVEGDTIVTSGFGGIYPKGIIVGRVNQIENDGGGLLKYAVLEPAVDFQKLEDVAVITASREAPPAPLTPPAQTPGTEGIQAGAAEGAAK
jgi:rod shape-determining protein MreC